MAKKVRNTVDSGKLREEDTNALQNYISSIAKGNNYAIVENPGLVIPGQASGYTRNSTGNDYVSIQEGLAEQRRADTAAKAPNTYGTGYNYNGMTSALSPILNPNPTQSQTKLNAIVTGQPQYTSDLYSPSTDDVEYGLSHELYGATQGVDGNPELRAIKSGTDISKGLRDGITDVDKIPYTGGSGNGGSGDGGNGSSPLSDLWTQRMEEIYNQLYNLPKAPTMGEFNGPEFSYDYRDDPSYQQYREQYIRNGQLAMKDTMGQAAGLTGGYGSSYSQNVGQQAYQGYMNQLNAVVPELYQNAYNRYLNDYKQQYTEFTDKYDADLNAYKAEMNKLGALGDIASAQQAREDSLNNPGGTDYSSLASLYKAGLWFDENGNIAPISSAANLSTDDAIKLYGQELTYDANGNLVQDVNNINGLTINELYSATKSALAKYKDKKWDSAKLKEKTLGDLKDQYTEKQLRYIAAIIDEYLS